MSEPQASQEMIHVIRRVAKYGVVSSVTRPTTKPVEFFEEKVRRRHPNATFKPSRSYEPWVFGVLERMALSRCQTLDQAIDQADARKAAQLQEGDLFVWRFDAAGCDQYWVAANTQEEAKACLKARRPNAKVYKVEQEPNLDRDGFTHGDPEDGEEAEPCTLRDLVKFELQHGAPPFLVAETEI